MPGSTRVRQEGCTRGGAGLGTGGVLYRVLPRTIPGTHIKHIPEAKPYPRPYEGKSEVNDEVS